MYWLYSGVEILIAGTSCKDRLFGYVRIDTGDGHRSGWYRLSSVEARRNQVESMKSIEDLIRLREQAAVPKSETSFNQKTE
jgi:hypothetical protein